MCSLGGPLCTRDFGPTLEAVLHLLAVRGGRPQMPSWSEVLGNRTIRGQKALGVPRRLEPVHAICTLLRRPVRVLAAIIEVAALPMFYSGQDLADSLGFSGKILDQ